MKRIILLVIVALLLVGCGLNSVPQEGLTNAVGAGKGDSVASQVKCDVHPLVGSQQAQVTCLLDIVDDSMKPGDALKLHLGGVLVTSEGESAFVNEKLINSSGIVLSGLPDKVASEDELIAVKEMALTAQMEGFSNPVEIVGVASLEGAKELKIPAGDGKETSTLTISMCEGTMIPNSNLASITIIGELKDGQQIAGGGILNTSIMSLADMCKEASAEGVVWEVDVARIVNAIIIRDTAKERFWGAVIDQKRDQ